ncbi:uncharacterized protein LOC119161605 isoform X2 [Rhipicephalus microplus]|uniref:uncharacterized protein LOC119161605 isoform X2 n=1 Tax=Rhipicephalus microplus TaxID=6941 RepID=UPI003F6D1B81
MYKSSAHVQRGFLCSGDVAAGGQLLAEPNGCLYQSAGIAHVLEGAHSPSSMTDLHTLSHKRVALKTTPTLHSTNFRSDRRLGQLLHSRWGLRAKG